MPRRPSHPAMPGFRHIHLLLIVIAVVACCYAPPVFAFSAFPSVKGFSITTRFASTSTDDEDAGNGDANDDADDEEDDEDDDENIKPYGNRSLAWTKRYRKLNPYDKVRRRVLQFGHRSKADWDDCVASGSQGQYVPSRPDEMFAPEWVSWDEFLGIIRPYEETRNIAVNILGLRSLDDYILFVQ